MSQKVNFLHKKRFTTYFEIAESKNRTFVTGRSPIRVLSSFDVFHSGFCEKR